MDDKCANTNPISKKLVGPACNTVYIRWFDGHFEKIEANASSIKFGSDNLVFTALLEMIVHTIPLRFVRWYSTSTESHQNPDKDRSSYAKKQYSVKVKWIDDYVEEFKATEYRNGSDLLWMRLDTGENRHIPLRSVRSFTVYEVLTVQKNEDATSATEYQNTVCNK